MSLSLKLLYSDVEVDFHAVRLLCAGFITAGEDSSVVLFKDGSVMGNHHYGSSRLPVGSSAIMTSGELSRALAIAILCCSPPESW